MNWLIGILIWVLVAGFFLLFNYGAHFRDREIDDIYSDEYKRREKDGQKRTDC